MLNLFFVTALLLGMFAFSLPFHCRLHCKSLRFIAVIVFHWKLRLDARKCCTSADLRTRHVGVRARWRARSQQLPCVAAR
jgi:hypothetical protein